MYVNHSRRTLQPGEQAYYHYGNRSNKFLLLNYGFCFAENKYNSYAFKLKLDLQNKIKSINEEELLIPSNIVDFN